MRAAADRLDARKDELARLMAEEMGKPIRQGAAEVAKCAWACEYYAEHAAAHLAPEVIPPTRREATWPSSRWGSCWR